MRRVLQIFHLYIKLLVDKKTSINHMASDTYASLADELLQKRIV